MGVTVFPGPAIPKSRRDLARYLHELADNIAADMVEIDPYAMIICLTGPVKHEVVHTGYDSKYALRGAAWAVQAVLTPAYQTTGGNMRSRDRTEYGGLSQAKVTPIIATARSAPPPKPQETP